MNDTPETDTAKFRLGDSNHFVVHEMIARKLERERNEALHQMEKYAAECKSAIEAHESAFRDRDELREYADKLAGGLPDGMLPKDVEVLREANLGLAMELAEAREMLQHMKS